VTLRTSLATLTSLWDDDRTWDDALRMQVVTLLGPTDARRQLPGWLGASAFAPVPRPVA
jgi:hypothetical protein